MNPKIVGIVSLVGGVVSAVAAVAGTIHSMATSKRNARITGEAAGQSYAITKDMLDHPEKYEEDNDDSKKELVPYI